MAANALHPSAANERGNSPRQCAHQVQLPMVGPQWSGVLPDTLLPPAGVTVPPKPCQKSKSQMVTLPVRSVARIVTSVGLSCSN